MQGKPIKSKQVFNYLFEKAREEGISLTPMKAIKLVYFCHAWHLGFKSKPLLDECAEAWQYGAVVPSLYHALKIYGSGDIRYPILKDQESYYIDIYLKNDEKISQQERVSTEGLSDEEKRVIDMVWNTYKHLDAPSLSGIMHMPNTPWTKTWNNGKCGRRAIIPDTLIEEYYKSQIEAAKNE